jgi:hypothetical protein
VLPLSICLTSSFGHLFFIEQFQAGAGDFRHGIYDRTQNLVGDSLRSPSYFETALAALSITSATSLGCEA